MMELIFSYFLTNNEPMFLYEPNSSSYAYELRLNVHHEFAGPVYFDLSPYVMRSREGITGRAGAEADVGVWIGDVALELYHHSSHNLDHVSPQQENKFLEMDTIRVKWRIK